MNLIAFLQNPWFKPGTSLRLIHMYRDNQVFHKKILSGCMTGRRLLAAFGELYWQIHWDNTNWRPAWHANGREEPDHEHIASVIRTTSPDLILTFGNQARDSVKVPGIQVMSCHHPNARYRTQAELDEFAKTVREFIRESERISRESR